MFIAKKRILSGEIHFWARIWLGRDDSIKVETEACDDGNSANGDGSKGRCQNRLFTYIFLRSDYLL